MTAKPAKVTSLGIRDFSAFKEVELSFSPGLNVFIGPNATGKSHAMKLLYCLLKLFPAEKGTGVRGNTLSRPWVTPSLQSVFMPADADVARLVRRGARRREAVSRLNCNGARISFRLTKGEGVGYFRTTESSVPSPVFLPAQDVLAMYEGFTHAYENRELSFDRTYHDLCVLLSAKPLRGPQKRHADRLLAPLKAVLGGEVILSGGRFYVRSGRGRLEAHLLAEGHRKIAALAHLVANGSIKKNGVLLWDEPEANLNPRLITEVASILRSLASEGVQIFVATHDYLLSHELSLAAEYKTAPKVDMRFFGFYRSRPNRPVEVQSAPTLAQLDKNPILDEFAAHYERELSLFHRQTEH